MDFEKKLKIRLYTAIAYTAIGIIMIVVFNLFKNDNNFLSYFGAGILVCGIARIRNYFLITKNEDTIRKRKIAETDERNIFISQRAKTAAFNVYIIIVCTAVIIFGIIGKNELTVILEFTVCILVFIYWISYWIISKKRM